MKKAVNFFKEHKLLCLFLILCLVVLIFLIKVVLIFTESDEKVFYGSRLEGESSINLDSSDTQNKISKKLGDQVSGVSVRKQGRIINIIIKLNSDTSRDSAKDLANQAVSSLTDEEKGYNDIQIFLNKENEEGENKQFPIVGYKHHTKESINWTKDR